MKKYFIFELLRNLRNNPKLFRKIKILAAVGFVGLFVAGGLTIWAGLSAFRFIASTATEVFQTPANQERLATVQSHLPEGLPQMNSAQCWDKVQDLIAVQPWIEKPVADNLQNLKQACFDKAGDDRQQEPREQTI